VDDDADVENNGATHELIVLDNDEDPDAGDSLSIVSVTQGSDGGAVSIQGEKILYTPATGFEGDETFTYTIEDNDGNEATATVTVTVTADDVGDASIAGFVYLDQNGNGQMDAREMGIPGVLITLTGSTDGGESVEETILTSDDGSYHFTGLEGGTYKLAESQPAALTDGEDSATDSGAAVTNDAVDDIDLGDTEQHTGNLFGERSVRSRYVTIRLFLASTPAFEQWLRGAVAQGEEDAGNEALANSIRDGEQNVANHSPVALADSYTAQKDTTLTVASANGVLDNDTDSDGDNLTASLVTNPAHGELTLNSNGSFTYTPDDSFVGTDTFTYRCYDGEFSSDIMTVTITVDGDNHTPVAAGDSYTVTEDNTLTVTASTGVLDNDTDSDGDDLNAVLADSPDNGDVTLDANGSFTYTPDPDFHGQDTFTYYASDGEVQSAETTVTITVAPANDAPVAADDAYTALENQTLSVTASNGLLDNDDDVDDSQIEAVLVQGPDHGQLTLDEDGSFQYVPDTDYVGDDTFTYHVSDGSLTSNTATVTITVGDGNHAPVANNDAYTVDEDNQLQIPVSLGVLDNDNDLDSDTLTAHLVDSPDHGTLTLNTNGSFTYQPEPGYHGQDAFTYKANDGTADSAEATVAITVNSVNDAPAGQSDVYTVAVNGTLSETAPGVLSNDDDDDDDELTAELVDYAQHGTVAVAANGSLTYTPDADFHGIDEFTYKAYDGTVYTDEITVYVHVNDAATPVDDDYEVDENSTLTVYPAGGVLANDSDPNGDDLSATLVTGPSHGSITLNADGSFTYTPEAGYTGDDTFTYAADDDFAVPATATVTITVEAVDEALASEESW
jgi:VCBS repeat-containing protein